MMALPCASLCLSCALSRALLEMRWPTSTSKMEMEIRLSVCGFTPWPSVPTTLMSSITAASSSWLRWQHTRSSGFTGEHLEIQSVVSNMKQDVTSQLCRVNHSIRSLQATVPWVIILNLFNWQDQSSAIVPLFRGFILSLCEDLECQKRPVDVLRYVVSLWITVMTWQQFSTLLFSDTFWGFPPRSCWEDQSSRNFMSSSASRCLISISFTGLCLRVLSAL